MWCWRTVEPHIKQGSEVAIVSEAPLEGDSYDSYIYYSGGGWAARGEGDSYDPSGAGSS